jgi:hypothetical protein
MTHVPAIPWKATYGPKQKKARKFLLASKRINMSLYILNLLKTEPICFTWKIWVGLL